MSHLDQTIQRFNTLYKKLSKRDNGEITLLEKIKLCKQIAKSEAITFPNNLMLFNQLNHLIAEVKILEQKKVNEQDLFLIFLSTNIQVQFSSVPAESLVKFLFEILAKAQEYIRNRKSENDIEMANDLSLKSDDALQSLLEMTSQVLGQVVKCGDHGQLLFLEGAINQLESYIKNNQGQILNLQEFAPVSIVYRLVECLMKNKRFQFTESVLKNLDRLLQITFSLFEIYKQNSHIFIISIASSSKFEEERQVRRMSVLFTDILELFVQFSCLYLKSLAKLGLDQIYIGHSIRLYQTLFSDQEQAVLVQTNQQNFSENLEYFTLRERLKILSELNSIFNLIPEIVNKKYYWRMIREGLSDTDNYCRKVSISVLKSNLHVMSEAGFYQGFVGKDEFELLWTTFFDIFDTLESFGSHLTKAVWNRTEVIYKYIKDKYTKGVDLHPLLDFREWLFVIYKRVQSHSNLKVRRFVIKATLKRTYVTIHMNEYIFDIFLKSLNKGLIFKDTNIYTQFSQSNELVNKFYEQYFSNESVYIAEDLRDFFRGFIKHVSYPQLTLCTLKILSREYKQNEGFIGNEELQQIHDMMNSYFAEQIFSSKYLCYKYVLSMLAQYIDVNNFKQLNISLLFKIIGKMPIQFFTNQTSYVDQEAHKFTGMFVERFASQLIQDNTILSYLKDLLEIKAVVSQMPKYGSEIQLIIQGLAKVLLGLGLGFEEQHYQWLVNSIRPSFEILSQIMNSSYLSPEVLDSKIKYLSILLKIIYPYADDKYKPMLRKEFIPLIPLALDRVESNLILPLTKYEQVQYQPSERQKIQSLYQVLSNYLDFVQISIQMTHIHQNQSNSPLEKFIKRVFSLLHQMSSSKELETLKGWGAFLLQYVLYQSIKKITHKYVKGIRDCVRKGIQYFMVPEDIFQIGLPLYHNILEFKQIPRPKDDDSEEFGEAKKFMIDNNTSLTTMAQETLLCQWKAFSELTQIFQYESQIKQEISKLQHIIADKAADFLQCTTLQYLTSIFRVLKLTYIPMLKQKLLANDDQQEYSVIEYQQLCYQMWTLVKELKTDFTVSILQEFLEFAFHPEIIEIYHRNLQALTNESVKQFHEKMADEMFEQGNKYWIVFRSCLNHLMLLFCNKPHLMKGFEKFVMNFAICREVRSLDADISLYQLQNLIPQIITKDYENLPMEEITYQGAYIRTITNIILEEMIRSHKIYLLARNEPTQNHIDFIDAIEKLIIMLLDINTSKAYIHADMPYSEKHRVKVRCWQTIIVLMEFLDPQLYTTLFRQFRLQNSQVDIIQQFNEKFWNIVGLNHLSSVRQYIEIVAIKFTKMYPELSIQNPLFLKTLLDPNIKAQVASSFLVIAGYILTTPLKVINENILKKGIFEALAGFLTSNSAHSRCVAQYFIYELQSNPNQNYRAFIPEGMNPLLNFLNFNKDVAKLVDKERVEVERIQKVVENLKGVHVILSTQIDAQGEFLSQTFIEKIRDLLSETISEIRKQDNMPIDREDLWLKELEIRKESGKFQPLLNEESSQNYQRKILPWEQVEYDYDLLKRVYDNRKRNEIIMCAALIDKVPNLAGLARTSEIMNASCLVINNKAVCDLDEFKGVSVTSEKWLPIVEVKEKNLYEYLEYQKSNGYAILGLEQTANSKMLHEYKFPTKCILLLGKEKEGIPQQYLNILDQCIEIPQFGIIRSLNVHVSGALCLWEYTKQNIPKKIY